MLILSDVYLIRTDARVVKNNFRVAQQASCAPVHNQNQLRMQNQRRRAARTTALPPPNRIQRHVLGRMDVRCCHCDAYIVFEERIAKSSGRNPRFQLCCKEEKSIFRQFNCLQLNTRLFWPKTPTKQNIFEGIFTHTTMHLFLRQAGPTLIEITPMDDTGFRRGECKWVFTI